jgi:hypothetical protein
MDACMVAVWFADQSLCIEYGLSGSEALSQGAFMAADLVDRG